MDHLYAMEDFVAFSHLMVKRNLVRNRKTRLSSPLSDFQAPHLSSSVPHLEQEMELSEIEALLQEEGKWKDHDVSSIAPGTGAGCDGEEEGLDGLGLEGDDAIPVPLTPEEEEAHLEVCVFPCRAFACFVFTEPD